MSTNDYRDLRDIARRHMEASTFRVNYTSGAAHGIYIGDIMAVRGRVDFVDENGTADFIATHHDNGKMLVPYHHIIPAWLTDLQSAKKARDVAEILGLLNHDGIDVNRKMTQGKWDIVNVLGRRGIASVVKANPHLSAWHFTDLGLYLHRGANVWGASRQ